MDPVLTHLDRLSQTDVQDVLALAGAADDTDGAYPLSEQALLRIRQDGAPSHVHLLIRAPERALIGYAHVEAAATADAAVAELVVHPMHRRRGLGTTLVNAALDAARAGTAHGRLHIWAHGDHPSAGAIALRLGFTRSRVLLQLRQPLAAALPEPELPAGVTVRAFRPGADDEAWLDVNARAFATHPEQGRWTRHDLRVRMAEPWFDPAGFLLAVRDTTDQLLGFHWTKVHGEPHDGSSPKLRQPIGEVYVLGVDPHAHGLGLGRALTIAGLRHLRDRGLDQAMLYVDESNTAAMALYHRIGFARWSVDVSYQHG